MFSSHRASAVLIAAAIILGSLSENCAGQARKSGTASQPRMDVYGDSLPAGASARMGTVRYRCIRDIYALAFSPDNKMLAGGGWGNAICLWDVVTGKEIRRFSGHQGWIWSLAFSPDGKTLASGSADHTIRLWETATGKEIRRLNDPQQPGGRPVPPGFPQQPGVEPGHIYSVTFSRDGKTLASAGHDKSVRLWSVSAGKELHTPRR